MTPNQELQNRIRLYLLGQLSNDAGEDFEQNILTNAELFEELMVVEDELIDEYLANELEQSERVNFERHFLATPERHEQLRFAQALNRHVTAASQTESVPRNFWQTFRHSPTFLLRAAAAIVGITLIAGLLWFFLKGTPAPQTFATLHLTISQSTRGGGAQVPKVTVPLSQDALKIVLRLPEEFAGARSYRLELESDNGETRSLKPVAQQGPSILVVIPASELKRGQYSLKVFAVGSDGAEHRLNGNYFFTVE
jgi:methionine-rich copper-binding protein CopC